MFVCISLVSWVVLEDCIVFFGRCCLPCKVFLTWSHDIIVLNGNSIICELNYVGSSTWDGVYLSVYIVMYYNIVSLLLWAGFQEFCLGLALGKLSVWITHITLLTWRGKNKDIALIILTMMWLEMESIKIVSSLFLIYSIRNWKSTLEP